MRSLYEVINLKAKTVKEDYDFSSDMNRLFSADFQGIRDIPELPIEAATTEWEEVSDFYKTSLVRTFSFDRDKHLRFFVNEILKTAEETMHHPRLNIEKLKVEVSLYTYDINEVSEQDLKMAKFIDEIFEDIKFIQEL
jgi:pterin-4a-carbinolamine dehydratase